MTTEETVAALDREIGSRIRLRRKEQGLSQTQLGEAIGVTFQQVQKYERGTNRVSSSTLILIARALDTTAPALLGGLDDPEIHSPTLDLTRRFLEHPHGLAIAQASASLSGEDLATVAGVAKRLAALRTGARALPEAA